MTNFDLLYLNSFLSTLKNGQGRLNVGLPMKFAHDSINPLPGSILLHAALMTDINSTSR